MKSMGFPTRSAEASIPRLPEVTQGRFQSMATRPVRRSSQRAVQHLIQLGQEKLAGIEAKRIYKCEIFMRFHDS